MGGRGGERRKRLPANPTILKNCVRPRTQLLIGAVLVVLITKHSKYQSNQVCFVYVRRTSISILKSCISKNQNDSQQVDCTEVPCHAKDLPVSENLCILFNSKSDFSSIMGTICFNLDAVKVGV